MFIENSFATPLFDFIGGGPAKAFRCIQCGKVTRTDRGMIMHLTRVHDFEEQMCLSSMESRNQERAQLERARIKSRLSKLLRNAPTTPKEAKQINQKSHGLSDEELLKLTSEEN